MTISSSTRTRILEQIATIDTQIDAVNTSYLAAINTEVEEYRFDSAEGSQRAVIRDPDKLLKQINRLEARRRSLENRLNGIGIMNTNLRRK